MGVTSLEDLQKQYKKWSAGKKVEQEMKSKATNAAPNNYFLPSSNTQTTQTTQPKQIPALDAVSRRKQIMEGTDPASESLKRAEAEKARKEQEQYWAREQLKGKTYFKDYSIFNDPRSTDPNSPLYVSPEGRTELLKRATETPQERFDRYDKRARELQSKDSLTMAEQKELDSLYEIGSELEKQIEGQKSAKKEEQEPEQKPIHILTDEEYNALDKEAKAITDKGPYASMEELNRYQEILDIVEQSEAEKKRQDVLAGKNHLVDNATYQKLMSDGRFANDIDKLVDVEWHNADQDATVSPEWAEYYGAKGITGGYTKDQFYTQLSKRYELTKAELHDIALSRKAERDNAETQAYAEQLENFGENHPILGSAGSLIGTVGSAVEGPFNVAMGGITGDDRYTSRMFNTTKSAPREGAKRNMESDITKGIYDVGMGVADMGTGALMGNAPLVLAGNTANDTMLNALDRGIDPRQAALYSAGSAAIDYITNTIGLDKAKELASQAIEGAGVKAALKQAGLVGVAGLGEGGENLVQDFAQSFLDKIVNGENSELSMAFNMRVANGMSEEQALQETAKEYANQEFLSFATGVAMGAAMYGGKKASDYVTSGIAGKALENYANRNALRVWEDYANWEAEQNNVDNVDNMVYNNATGGIENGPNNITDGGTGSEDILRGVREEGPVGEGVRGDEPTGRGQLSGDSVFSPNELETNPKAFDDNDVQTLNNNGIETPNFTETNNNAQRFADAFEAARQSNKNGAAVDARDAANIQEIIDNGGKVYLTDDGTMGFAVEGDGNLTAVFKHSSNETPGMASRATLAAVKNGAYRGDCYGRKLVNMYSRGGFEPVGRMKYGYGFNEAMDAQVRQQLAEGKITKEPDVYVLKLRDGYDFNKAAQDFNTAKKYTQAELDSLPEFTDYDEMLAYRDSLIKQPTSEVASSMPEAPTPEAEAPQIPHLGETPSAVESGQSRADAETKRINNFMDSKRTGSIEAGGHTIEHYSKKDMVNILKEYKQGGDCPPDVAISILYNDGTTAHYTEGDDLSGMKLTNINSVIYGNENTDAFSGNYVKAYNDYSEEAGETFDDGIWRLDFKDAQEERAARENTQQIPQVGEIQSAVMEPEVTPENVNNNVRVDLNGEADTDDTSRTMAEDTGIGNIPRDENGSIILEEELPPSGAFTRPGEARFMTREAIDSGVITPKEYNDSPVLQEMASIARHNNDKVYFESEKFVRDHGKEWLNDVIKGNKVLGAEPDRADYDFNSGMIVLQGLAEKIELASSPKEKAKYTALRNAMLSKMRAFSTNAARTLQAHKMWTNTADGMMMAQQVLSAQETARYMSKHQDIARENARIARSLKLQGYDGSMDVEKVPKTHEQIRQEVINTLDREFGSVRDKFDDNAIEYLTRLAEDKSIPIWQITDEIEHYLNHGTFYTIDESIEVSKAKSSKLAKAFDEALGGKQKDKTLKSEDGYYKTLEKVKNTLDTEYSSVRDQFNDNDIDFIVTMLMEKLPTWQIADEIRHKLEHGTWYTIDESTKVKKQTSGKLASILAGMGDDGRKAKNQVDENGYPKKSHATYVEEVRNSLQGEYASLGLDSDTDVEFIATMLEEGVSRDVIEDEIHHRLQTGEWYTIDESIQAPKPESGMMRRALRQMEDVEEAEAEAANQPISLDEMVERVKNTLNNEASGTFKDLDDEEYRFLATLLQNNASAKDIAGYLDQKAKTGRFTVSSDAQDAIYKLGKYLDTLDPESEQFYKTQLEMFRILANETEINRSALDKFDAWRNLAMLGNPKTMLRNLIGNTVFRGVTSVSNAVSGVLEEAVDRHHYKKTGEHIDRTKKAYNPLTKANKAFIDAAQNDFNLKRYVSGAGSKYDDMKKGIKEAKSPFNSKTLQFLDDLKNKGISDTTAVKKKYATSLVGYMKANGLTEADMDASYKYDELRRLSRKMDLTPTEKAEMARLKDTAAKMEKARDYALKQAEYATFHQDSKLASMLSAASGKSDLAKVFIDGLVPFKKTPINILKSGLEYSPLGIGKSGYLQIKYLRENSKKNANRLGDTYTNWRGKEVQRTTANDVIESWGRTFTGTGLAAIGYALFKNGILQLNDKDERHQDELEGLQNYSIKFNIGGKNHTYTIEWAAPSSMALLMGAEIARAIEAKGLDDDDLTADDFIRIINESINPIVETSMLQGVQNTMENAARIVSGYDNDTSDVAGGIIGTLGATIAGNYLSQGIPTLSGQFARAIDDKRRSTDTISESPLLSELERAGRKTANKIPFLSKINKPYVDARGEEQNNLFGYNKGEYGLNAAKFAGNLLYQMASPGYYDNGERRPSDEISWNAYNGVDEEGNRIKDKGVFSSWKVAPKVNGKKLNPEQAYEYRKAAGQTREALKTALANEDWFNNMSPTKQTEMLKSINNFADEVGKKAAVPEYQTSNKMYAEFAKSKVSDEQRRLEGGVQNVLNYLKAENHKDSVKETMGTTDDFATALYDEGDQNRINKYNYVKSVNASYGKDSVSEEDFLTYENLGDSELRKELDYWKKAQTYGVSDTKDFREAVLTNKVDQYVDTYKAITSTQKGKDRLGRPVYLEYSKPVAQIYEDKGQTGLDEYADYVSRLPDGLSKAGDADKLDALNETSMPKEDAAYLFVTGKDSIAQTAPQPSYNGSYGDYLNTYMWYQVKSHFNSDENKRSLSKDEKANLYKYGYEYLKSLGYSDEQAKTALTWEYK